MSKPLTGVDMGRRSIAEKHWNERARVDRYWNLEEKEDEKVSWMVAYNFKSKPNSKFWKNLKKVEDFSPDSLFSKLSLIISDNRHLAYTAVKIIEHYGGEVFLYKGLRVECVEASENGKVHSPN